MKRPLACAGFLYLVIQLLAAFLPPAAFGPRAAVFLAAVFPAWKLGGRFRTHAVLACTVTGAALLLRAAAGGHILPEKLKAAGMHVTDVPLYDTEYRCTKADELRAMLEAGEIDVVTFTSISTVEGFVQAVGAADYTGFTALCIGEQTAQAARKHNMNVKIAENATIDAMIACLLEES